MLWFVTVLLNAYLCNLSDPPPLVLSFSPVAGAVGSVVKVKCGNLPAHLEQQLYCQFQRKSVIARPRTRERQPVECVVPPDLPPGPVSLSISSDGKHWSTAATFQVLSGGGGHDSRAQQQQHVRGSSSQQLQHNSLVHGPGQRHPIPTVTELYPDFGVGGSLVSVFGQGFEDTPNLACRFGPDGIGQVSPAAFRSPTQLACQAPANRVSGSVTVYVSLDQTHWSFPGEPPVKFRFVPPRMRSDANDAFLAAAGQELQLKGGAAAGDGDDGGNGDDDDDAGWATNFVKKKKGPGDQADQFHLYGPVLREKRPPTGQDLLDQMKLEHEGDTPLSAASVLFQPGKAHLMAPPVAAHVSAVLPSHGPAGTELEIRGTGFVRPPATTTTLQQQQQHQDGDDDGIGGNNYDSSLLLCRIGSNVVKARFVSSTILSCEAPARPFAGPVFVEVSNNGGVSFTTDERQFVYDEGQVHPRVVAVDPRQAEPGANVTLYGARFIPRSPATDASASTRAADETSIKWCCAFVPIAEKTKTTGDDDDGMSDDDDGMSDELVALGADVVVSAGHVVPSTVGANPWALQCTAPTLAQSNGVTQWRVEASNDCVRFSRNRRRFQFGATRPFVVSVFPHRVALGQLITLHGFRLRPSRDQWCQFLTDPTTDAALVRARTPAVYVSDSTMHCRAPTDRQVVGGGGQGGPVFVHVTGTVSQPVQIYVDTSLDQAVPAVVGVEPALAPVAGLPVVRVQGQLFRDTDSLVCRFGPQFLVGARFLSTSVVECQAPAASLVWQRPADRALHQTTAETSWGRRRRGSGLGRSGDYSVGDGADVASASSVVVVPEFAALFTNDPDSLVVEMHQEKTTPAPPPVAGRAGRAGRQKKQRDSMIVIGDGSSSSSSDSGTGSTGLDSVMADSNGNNNGMPDYFEIELAVSNDGKLFGQSALFAYTSRDQRPWTAFFWIFVRSIVIVIGLWIMARLLFSKIAQIRQLLNESSTRKKL